MRRSITLSEVDETAKLLCNLLLRPKSPVLLRVVERFLLRDPCLKFLSEILSSGTSGLGDSGMGRHHGEWNEHSPYNYS